MYFVELSENTLLSHELGHKNTLETEDIIVFLTGRIHNCTEIKELLSLPLEFSELETLAEMYKQKSIQFTKLIRGEFSLLIWDKAKKKCALVRDQLGIKPIYYRHVNKRFYISDNPVLLAKSINGLLNRVFVQLFLTG